MTHNSALEPHIASANTWLTQLRVDLGLRPTEQRRALHALRAGLHAIRDRLPVPEVLDLGAQLPAVIRGFYYDGWTLTPKPRHRAAMLARVKAELGSDARLHPVEVLRGVIRLLVTHVSPGEIADVVATLPRPIAALWHELAAEPAPPPPVYHPTHRTGYSR